MAGLITSLLELGLEGELLNILVQKFKVTHIWTLYTIIIWLDWTLFRQHT